MSKYGEPWTYNTARTLLNVKSDGGGQVVQFQRVQILVAERIIHCVNTCADLTDAEVTAMRELWNVKEQVKVGLEGAIGSINIGAQLDSPMSELAGGHLADGVARITAALALLEGGGE